VKQIDWFLTAIALVLTITAICVIMPPVYADVPDVQSIVPWTSGTDTVLNITVRHALPSSSHYIYKVEVDVAGTVHVVDLTSPQTSTTFVVQYNMGSLTSTPSVRARAFCNVHDVGPWSQQVVVSEFSALNIILALAIISIAALLIKFKFHDLSKRAFLGSKKT
jgi:desulfoferrodoxin (superoxide reductase-like protein)